MTAVIAETVGGFSEKKKRRAELLLLGIVVVATACIIFRSFLFGDSLFLYNDSEDDTFQSYISTYQMMASRLAEGDFSLYTTVLGTGGNLMTAQMIAYDPFAAPAYVVGALFGIEWVAHALVFVQILRILCAAFAFRYFLCAFSLGAFARCIAAWVYAFSTFSTGIMGQHYMFATVPVFLALLLGLIERAVSNRRRLLHLGLTVALLALWSTYFFYIVMLACGFYLILRFFQQEKISWMAAVRWFLPVFLTVLCGAALAGAVMVPSALVMLGSSARLQTGVSVAEKLRHAFRILSPAEIKTQILRFFSNQLQGTPWQWQGTPNHFLAGDYLCCALVPIGAAQYIWALLKGKLGRPKVATLAFVLMLAVATVTRFFGSLFNFFVEYATRYTVVFLPILGFLIAWVIRRAVVDRRFSLPVGVLSAAVSTGLILWGCSWPEIGPAISGAAMIAVVWGATVLLHLLTVSREDRRFAGSTALTILIGIGICVESTISLTSKRSHVKKEVYQDTWSDEATAFAIEKYDMDGDDFVRVERNFAGWGIQQAYTYSCVEMYRGLSYYNSLSNNYYNDFRERILGTTRFRWDWDRRVGYAFGAVGRPLDSLTADLLGLKYVVSDYPTADLAWRPVAEQLPGSSKVVYENTSIGTAGLLYTNYCTLAEFETMTPMQRQAMPAHTLLLQNAAAPALKNDAAVPLQQISEGWLPDTVTAFGTAAAAQRTRDGFVFSNTGGAENTVGVDLNADEINKPERQAFVRMRVRADMDGTLDTYCVNDFIGFSSIIWSGVSTPLIAGETTELLMKLPADAQALRFFYSTETEVEVSDIELWVSDGRTYSNEGVYLRNPDMGGVISGTVIARQDSVLMVPICMENGWRVWLDGKETPLLLGQLAFLSVEVPAGQHQVEFRYQAPGQNSGYILSVAGLLGMAVLAFVTFGKVKSVG